MLAGEISTINESKKNDFNASEWVDECYDALNDDFNSPKLIAKLFDSVAPEVNMIYIRVFFVAFDD